jgi:chromosome segregation ATPase
VNTTPLHLSEIYLSGFRGIEQSLPLNFGKRLTIIYGGNATGKSSVAQAIEFTLSGQVHDYEEGVIPGQYLVNTHVSGPGHVDLTLSDGTILTALTSDRRTDIENRFREVCGVEWPERQGVPLSATHVTSQGMLAKILGSNNAVTRNDLSGLCAGAYLRLLVSRAQKMTDYFRQAASGRNIQSDLREAKAGYETAKLLLDSLKAQSEIAQVSLRDVTTTLAEAAAQLNLPQSISVGDAIAHVNNEIGQVQQQLRLAQSLLARSRELGQNEAELKDLTERISQSEDVAGKRQKELTTSKEALGTIAEQFDHLVKQRTSLMESIAAYERRQQSVSAATVLEERLRQISVDRERRREQVESMKNELEDARRDLAVHSSALAQLKLAHHTTVEQRGSAEKVLDQLRVLPSDRDIEAEEKIEELRHQIDELVNTVSANRQELARAVEVESAVSSRLRVISRSGERLLAAMNEMRSFVTDSRCPMCGHDHVSIDALNHSIEEMSSEALRGSETLRLEFEARSTERRQLESDVADKAAHVALMRSELSRLMTILEGRARERKAAVLAMEETLRRADLPVQFDASAIRRAKADLETRVERLQEDLVQASRIEHEDESHCSQLEQAIAAKTSELDQLARLAVDLNQEIVRLANDAQSAPDDQQHATNKAELTHIDMSLRALEREQGQLYATIAELERSLGEITAGVAGAQRRAQAVQAFLASVDNDLSIIGASRDMRTIVNAEERAKGRNDELVALMGTLREVEKQERIKEANRALANAQEQFTLAEHRLRSDQARQELMQSRSSQFSDLQLKLERVQNDTAEIVLNNVRTPVEIIFRAMTAGAPWDIEFRLEEGRISAVLSDGMATGIAASSVLNSAYVNVAAIALRLALASQQQWTRLRTVVLDDPILEMDHLTQSALIDGLEAILSSAFQPWQDLQFVLTTWSEDFAVMAAHKLAHLNHNEREQINDDFEQETFVIHRLISDPEGHIVSQRHVPRWRREANAA